MNQRIENNAIKKFLYDEIMIIQNEALTKIQHNKSISEFLKGKLNGYEMLLLKINKS